MKNLLSTLTILLIFCPLSAFSNSIINEAETNGTDVEQTEANNAEGKNIISQEASDTAKSENSDDNLNDINPDLVPKAASPGESVGGRTEFTTPEQNQEIMEKYEQLQHDGNSSIPAADEVDSGKSSN